MRNRIWLEKKHGVNIQNITRPKRGKRSMTLNLIICMWSNVALHSRSYLHFIVVGWYRLSILMDIPLSESAETGNRKIPLLQVALEQNRSTFLNNERLSLFMQHSIINLWPTNVFLFRINAVLRHVWQQPSGLDPAINISRKSFSAQEKFKLLINQPFHFYLTPMVCAFLRP